MSGQVGWKKAEVPFVSLGIDLRFSRTLAG